MNANPNAWNADLYTQKHAFVFQYGADLLNRLDPQPGERILDLGCGTGELTQKIADAGAAVIGADASAEMVGKARRAFPGVDFRVMDARSLAFGEPFDAVFTNATLHWISEADQPTVLTNVLAALKPGGRFVGEMGGQHNVERIIAALADALTRRGLPAAVRYNYFPSVGQYAPLLEAAGFRVTLMTHFDRDTVLDDPETGVIDWIRMFRGDAVNNLSAADRDAVFADVKEALRPVNFRDGRWFADYKRLRFVAMRH